MSPGTGKGMRPGSVIGHVVVYDGDVCRVRVSDDGETVVPEVWKNGRWVSGGDPAAPAAGRPICESDLRRFGIPEIEAGLQLNKDPQATISADERHSKRATGQMEPDGSYLSPGDLHVNYDEYRQLAQEHAEYSERLHRLIEKRYLTEEEKLEEVRLKKLKLRLRDAMTAIEQQSLREKYKRA